MCVFHFKLRMQVPGTMLRPSLSHSSTVPSGRNMAVFSGHTASVTCGKFLPDGKRLITGSEDGSFIIWDPKTSSPVHKLSSTDARFRLEDGVTCLSINGNGTSAIVGGADGGLRIVNLTNGQLLSSLEGHQSEAGSSVEAVAWSQGTPGSSGLWVSVGTDKKIRVFEASNGSVRWTGEHEVSSHCSWNTMIHRARQSLIYHHIHHRTPFHHWHCIHHKHTSSRHAASTEL